MEQQGVLRSWNDDKGFGFIRGKDGDYFVHISSVRGEHRPLMGKKVYFVAGTDEQGRLRAQHMRGAELGIDQPSIRHKHKNIDSTSSGSQNQRRQRPLTANNLKRSLSLWITACIIPALGVWHLFTHNGVLWPLLLYVGMSVLSVVQYWRDKHNAQSREWRTPEKQLHAVELFGGWPGALLAQQLLRHKTQKTSYQAVFWLIVLAHQVYWLDLIGFDGQLLQQVLSKI